MCFDDERFLFIPADVQVYFSFYEYFSFLFCEFDWIYDFRAGVYPEPGPIGECDGRTPADRYDQLVKFLCLCRIAFWTEVHLFGVDIYLSFVFLFELGFRPVNGQLLVVGKDQLHFFICTVWCRIGLDDCQIVCFGIFRPQGGIPADC